MNLAVLPATVTEAAEVAPPAAPVVELAPEKGQSKSMNGVTLLNCEFNLDYVFVN